MKHKLFLHELPNARDLFELVAGEQKIVPAMVEKDYWLMHCLWGLQAQKFVFELKGGTSLSKGFGIINRFSEDVDIRIQPPAALNVKAGKNHNKSAHIESRNKFYNWLTEELAIPDMSAERAPEFDNEKLTGAGIRLVYPATTGVSDSLKSFVLLEVGFDITTPNEPRDISSWAFTRASAAVEIRDNRASGVACYLPEYTLVEKLQAISTKFRQTRGGGTVPAQFIRHYYDVFELLGQRRVLDFIGSEKYRRHKADRFRGGDEGDLRRNEAFVLADRSTREFYRAEYAKMEPLIYSKAPTFDEILDRIEQHIEKLSVE